MNNEKIKQRHHSYFFPYLLILIGIIFLLNNLGLVSFSIWSILWKFWPVIIIFIGLNIIFGKSRFYTLIINLIMFLIIAFVLLFSISAVNPSFNETLKKHFPFWGNIEKTFPEENLQIFNVPEDGFPQNKF